MNSANDIWPDGLVEAAAANWDMGNIMDHHLGVGAGGTVEGYDDKYYFGRRANGIYIPQFRKM